MSKEEIINTRKIGFGSSDAKMIISVGKSGKLNLTAKKRIAVLLEKEEQKQFHTTATNLGNEIENTIFEILKNKYSNISSNPFYKSEFLSKIYGYNVFNHIDYEILHENKVIWFEVKSTKNGVAKAYQDYKSQLAWHKMLLNEKSNGNGILYFVHYDTSKDNSIFDASRLTIEEVKDEFIFETNFIYKGLEILREEIKSFIYEKPTSIDAYSLPAEIQNQLETIRNAFLTIKENEKKVKDFQSRITEIMSLNNIKQIKNDAFIITLIPESETQVIS